MNDVAIFLLGLLMLGLYIFIFVTRARWRRYYAEPDSAPAPTAPRFREGDRVVLLRGSPYLREYHNAETGSLGTITGWFSGTSPDEPVSTCMVKWDASDDAVRCSFDEILTVSHAVHLHAHRHARATYGTGPDAVSRRVGFESGVEYLASQLPQAQLEQLLRTLGPVPEFETGK